MSEWNGILFMMPLEIFLQPNSSIARGTFGSYPVIGIVT